MNPRGAHSRDPATPVAQDVTAGALVQFGWTWSSSLDQVPALLMIDPHVTLVSTTERKRLRAIVHSGGRLGAPGACRLWTCRHR
jgi:hypothetical protein